MKWKNARFGIVLVLMFLLYLLAAGKLFYWQVIKAEELHELGKQQSAETIEIPANRGKILTSDNFPIATNTISYLLYSNPKVIENKEQTAKLLSPILEMDEATISARLEQDLFWVKLGEFLTPDKKRSIDGLNIEGLGFQQQYSRFYPEASMAAHLVGFLGKNENGDAYGYFGIEGKYNNQLAGRDGALYAIKDALGNQVVSDIREDIKIDGRDVKLTIDRTMQFSVNARLKEGIENYEAEGGSVIIMDSATGKILAMASYPDFDPGLYYEYNTDYYTNPVISKAYEPGSTFKVLIMASAINEGLVMPETRCDICAGPLRIGEYTIRTWNNEYHANSTMRDVIVHSDNTGMVFAGQKLGLNKIQEYLEKFGFYKPTGVDLQGETSGAMAEKTWYPIDVATASFGQGISVTPLQLINAVNSLANGGKLMKPYVVDEIMTDEGEVIKIKPEVVGETVSREVARQMTEIMVDAVKSGESKWVGIDNYRIAGKTGTAQIPVAGRYDPNQTIASFIGFFPANDPEYTMLVLVDRPKTSIYGSETAAPIFFNIARDIIKYKNLPSN